MTWTLKYHPLPGSPMKVDYECPDCGLFEQTVTRDEHGDPPATIACPNPVEYSDDEFGECERKLDEDDARLATGLFCATEEEIAPYRRTTCGQLAERHFGAAKIQYWSRPPTPVGYASKSDVKDPRALDTEPLATGKMTRKEWDKYQRGITLERRYQRRLKSGRISKRVQVGGG
jgi:hypothetical protein